MGKETGIAWTTHTFNCWWGCTKVSPGCDHCYAETMDKRTGGAHWGKGAPRRAFGEKHWNEPLKWNAEAKAAGEIHRVFCASMADVMDDEAPEGQRERLWELIDQTPSLMWQLLTKRPQRYVRYLPSDGFKNDNVILGCTTEKQEFYDLRLPLLIEAATVQSARGGHEWVKTFVSYEPALGPITMNWSGRPDWLIFGGETGAGRRPMEEKWARDIAAECREFGVDFFMKQMSAGTPKLAAELIPVDLLVRQFPGESALTATEDERHPAGH